MAVVRVLIWDEENYLQRISLPEDCFLIEAIDASGSDSNILKIGPFSASSVCIGRDNISTFVSGVLSGNFITGTFLGNGSELRGLVQKLNQFTGSVSITAGPKIYIHSASNNISITGSFTARPEEYFFTSSLGIQSTTAPFRQEFMYLSATLSGGTYFVQFSTEMASNAANKELTGSFVINNQFVNDFAERPSLDFVYFLNTGFHSFSASAGNHVFKILYNNESGQVAYIKNGKIVLWRVL